MITSKNKLKIKSATSIFIVPISMSWTKLSVHSWKKSDFNENKGSKKRIQLKGIGQNMVFTMSHKRIIIIMCNIPSFPHELITNP